MAAMQPNRDGYATHGGESGESPWFAVATHDRDPANSRQFPGRLTTASGPAHRGESGESPRFATRLMTIIPRTRDSLPVGSRQLFARLTAASPENNHGLRRDS